jgi:hypothetical protein
MVRQRSQDSPHSRRAVLNWLSEALKHQNWWAIMAAIARGMSRVGHHQFMDTICGTSRTEEGICQVIHGYQSGQMGQRT